MGFFSRRRDSESPNQSEPKPDPMDPMAALERAEKALAETDFASDGNGHWQRIDPEMKETLNETLEKARSSLESGSGANFNPPAMGEGVPSAFAQPAPVEDPITKVERLAKLRDGGALTQEEFDEQKRKALEEG